MGLSPDADAMLRQLADGTGHDLTAALDQLLAHGINAVPSCVGVSLTVFRAGSPVTVSAVRTGKTGERIASSLAMRLPASAGADDAGGRALTLYASAPNAFGAMAADLLALLDLDPRRAIVDGHLEQPAVSDADRSLRQQVDDVSTIDRALGVLLDRGFLAADGRRELDRLAADGRISLAGAAQLVIDAVRRPPPDPVPT